ncbi:MAG: c-type cytochrome [Gammaproteobacteria bacterium]|nr:c-type cytochrome [Gammaproteobacteria bacterium]
MRLRHALILLAVALAGAASGAFAAGDPARGEKLAITCMGCHGIEGYRNAYPSYRVPKLGGQNADYLVLALQGYRAGTRSHPTMRAQAATMSDEEIQDIVAFLAAQGPAQAGDVVTGGKAARGQEKAAVCAACHGEAGISSAPNWPNLAGQHRDYLQQAITRYRDKARQDPVMQAQAATLSDDDIADLAAYFSAQRGLFTTRN